MFHSSQTLPSPFLIHIHDLSPICIQINTTGVTSGAGIYYPPGAPEFIPGFQWGSCYSIFYMYVLQIIVCPFVLFLLAIVLYVLLRYTDSDHLCGIFKLFLLISVLSTRKLQGHLTKTVFKEIERKKIRHMLIIQKCLYQVRVITVFTVFRLLTDFVCLYTYEF